MFRIAIIFIVFMASWYFRDVSGALMDCSTNGQPDCDAPNEPHSICRSGTCACLATYQEVSNDCARVSCASDYSACTKDDVNSFCDISDYKCDCKTNFGGDSVDCYKTACTNNLECSHLSNTYCATGVTDYGCTCGFNTPADSTTGVCTPIPCTLANAATTCTGGASCIANANTYQCFCAANYIPGATSCVQKPCIAAGDCDADPACVSSLCVCASTFLASGNKCKKQCTEDGAGICHAQATCSNGVCECNVNYEGNGATCSQLACISVTTCHPNSQCSSSRCMCATGFVADGTLCRRSCTAATSNTTCSPNAICINDKCECKQNYAGDGSICEQKSCLTATDCPGNNTACSSNLCTRDTGYEISSTAIECVQPSTCTDTTTATTTTTTTTTTTVTSTKTSTNTEL